MLKNIFQTISGIHLRGLVFLVGLTLALVSWRPNIVEVADHYLFKMATWLMEAPKGASGIVVIQVPQDDLDTWQSDINQAGKLGALLSNILHTSESVIGIVLEHPIDARTATADTLLDDIAKLPSGDKPELALARELSQRKSFLLAFLRNQRVVVGVYDRRFPDAQPYIDDWGRLGFLPNRLRDWLWKNASGLPVALPGSVVPHHSIYPRSANQHVLIRPTEENSASADFVMHYLQAEQTLSGLEQPGYLWQRDRGIQLGSISIPMSPEGAILALYGATERMTPELERISLDEAMARGSFSKRVYISAEGSELATELAITTHSIEKGMVLHSPWWANLLGKFLLLVLTGYLVWILPRMSSGTGKMMSVLLLFILFTCQTVAQATQKIWLPFSVQMIWLALGHVLIIVWSLRRREWQRLVLRADQACVEQSRSLIDRGELEAAGSTLASCGADEPVLAAMYELSNAYASKRQYQQAVAVLEDLRAKRKNFRDVKEKVAALKSMMVASDIQRDPGKALDSTVVLDTPQIEKPVLGRYEIREELGRGAMGTVYLAYDPKISRQVAVKTLSYQQFQGKELDEIKNRFFREAEAAGRLSHPNIVSVFDVGEEHDMAFIAMDFAEGKPLNAFVKKDALLPQFEVYRIICDVAQALEYAHNNSIVHRDIKPGNIMYNPSPYQLKVTDFGIARLIDNSKTSTGEILGSPLYMAPEQLKGKKVNHLADIFSLGVTFYQLLSGQLPFQGENLASLTYEIIHGKHKSVKSVRKDLPTSATRIINQALQKDPDDRYSSAAEMAMVIKKAIKRDFAHEAKRAGYL